MAFYQTTKERYNKYHRQYVMRKEENPSLAASCTEVTDIMMKMDEKLVRTFWKIPGFLKEDGTQLKKTYVDRLSYVYFY